VCADVIEVTTLCLRFEYEGSVLKKEKRIEKSVHALKAFDGWMMVQEVDVVVMEEN
jgi:hypothetical protein